MKQGSTSVEARPLGGTTGTSLDAEVKVPPVALTHVASNDADGILRVSAVLRLRRRGAIVELREMSVWVAALTALQHAFPAVAVDHDLILSPSH